MVLSHDEQLFQSRKQSLPASNNKLARLAPFDQKMDRKVMTKYQDFDEPVNYRMEGGKGGGVFKTKRNTLPSQDIEKCKLAMALQLALSPKFKSPMLFEKEPQRPIQAEILQRNYEQRNIELVAKKKFDSFSHRESNSFIQKTQSRNNQLVVHQFQSIQNDLGGQIKTSRLFEMTNGLCGINPNKKQTVRPLKIAPLNEQVKKIKALQQPEVPCIPLSFRPFSTTHSITSQMQPQSQTPLAQIAQISIQQGDLQQQNEPISITLKQTFDHELTSTCSISENKSYEKGQIWQQQQQEIQDEWKKSPVQLYVGSPVEIDTLKQESMAESSIVTAFRDSVQQITVEMDRSQNVSRIETQELNELKSPAEQFNQDLAEITTPPQLTRVLEPVPIIERTEESSNEASQKMVTTNILIGSNQVLEMPMQTISNRGVFQTLQNYFVPAKSPIWVKKMHFSAQQWIQNEKKYNLKDRGLRSPPKQPSPMIKNSPILPPKKLRRILYNAPNVDSNKFILSDPNSAQPKTYKVKLQQIGVLAKQLNNEQKNETTSIDSYQHEHIIAQLNRYPAAQTSGSFTTAYYEYGTLMPAIESPLGVRKSPNNLCRPTIDTLYEVNQDTSEPKPSSSVELTMPKITMLPIVQPTTPTNNHLNSPTFANGKGIF